jgi:hypothetical protein
MKKLFLISILTVLLLPIAFAADVQISFDKATVQAGGQVTITYHQPEGKAYGIIQTLPTGWTATGASPDGKVRSYVDSGADSTLVVTAPVSSVTSSFTGQYFVVPETTYSSFQATTVTVGAGGSSIPVTTSGKSNTLLIVGIVAGVLLLIWFASKKK